MIRYNYIYNQVLQLYKSLDKISLVKEITYDKNGKLISTMILNEVNW